jgi:arabinose-5-phosphate isomerase
MRLTAGDLMHGGAALPRVEEAATLHAVLVEILEKRLGITTVLDLSGRLAGVVTDGDLKRILLAHPPDAGPLWALSAREIMTRGAKTCAPDTRVAAAVRSMEDNPGGAITALVVVDAQTRPLGILHLHDCLRAGWR